MKISFISLREMLDSPSAGTAPENPLIPEAIRTKERAQRANARSGMAREYLTDVPESAGMILAKCNHSIIFCK